MPVEYEVVVWSGGDNHITGENNCGEVDFFSIKEVSEAWENLREKMMEGFFDAYITVKKHPNSDRWDEAEEYGNFMKDCTPMKYLPKYVKKNLGETIVSLDFTVALETLEEVKAFFAACEA